MMMWFDITMIKYYACDHDAFEIVWPLNIDPQKCDGQLTHVNLIFELIPSNFILKTILLRIGSKGEIVNLIFQIYLL